MSVEATGKRCPTHETHRVGRRGVLALAQPLLDFVLPCVATNDMESFAKVFQMVGRNFRGTNAAPVTEISASFLEHLDLGLAWGNPSWANGRRPGSLKAPYDALRAYQRMQRADRSDPRSWAAWSQPIGAPRHPLGYCSLIALERSRMALHVFLCAAVIASTVASSFAQPIAIRLETLNTVARNAMTPLLAICTKSAFWKPDRGKL